MDENEEFENNRASGGVRPAGITTRPVEAMNGEGMRPLPGATRGCVVLVVHRDGMGGGPVGEDCDAAKGLAGSLIVKKQQCR